MMMKSQSRYTELFRQSPNYTRGVRNECLGIVLHHSATTYQSAINHCLDDKADNRVSYHVLISMSGARTVVCKDEQRAWHAGVSTFKGRKDCNSFLLGLAFEGDTSKRDLTDAEIASAIEYILPRYIKYKWDESCITTHQAITFNQATQTSRKVDISAKAYAQFMTAFRQALNEIVHGTQVNHATA